MYNVKYQSRNYVKLMKDNSWGVVDNKKILKI